MMTARDVIDLLGLRPLAGEGGYFVETYRARHVLPGEALPGHDGPRALKTAIYYLITPESFSTLHRIRSDEMFHFYAGDAVELFQLTPEGAATIQTLGTDLRAGERPQALVAANVWQGLRLREGGVWALLGTTVAPGFDFGDFEIGNGAELEQRFPQHAAMVRLFTR